MGKKNHKGFSNAKENIASDYNQKKSPPAKTNFIHAASEAYNKGNWEQCLKLLSSNNKQVGDNPRLLGLKGTCHKKLKNITNRFSPSKRELVIPTTLVNFDR